MARIGFISLGCEKNTYDTECAIGALLSEGHEITGDPSEADCVIINTCGFIEPAREEARENIRDMLLLKKDRPSLKVLITGCYAQKYLRELEELFPEADGILGIELQHGIGAAIDRLLSGGRLREVRQPSSVWREPEPGRCSLTPFWTGNLKITEGCNNRCSYCAIPSIRGSLRSRPIESAVAEARSMAVQGTKELVIIGQDTTAYGKDLGEPGLICRLIEELSDIDGICWIRLMYTYPDEITDRLIETIAASPVALPYIDMPLQHASDAVLRRMNRRGTAESCRQLIGRLRRAMPDICLRTTFIAGFPGETDEEYRELLDFAAEMRFDRAGFFAYSPEPGTPARDMEQVPEEVKKERLAGLALQQERISLTKNSALAGRELQVLTEVRDRRGSVGRCYRDAPEVDGVVYIRGGRPAPGEMVRVRITGAVNANDLQGTLIK